MVSLKELCEDKISIAKMSCIENGKAKADKELLEYIAKKIHIDFSFGAHTFPDRSMVLRDNPVFRHKCHG